MGMLVEWQAGKAVLMHLAEEGVVAERQTGKAALGDLTGKVAVAERPTARVLMLLKGNGQRQVGRRPVKLLLV